MSTHALKKSLIACLFLCLAAACSDTDKSWASHESDDTGYANRSQGPEFPIARDTLDAFPQMLSISGTLTAYTTTPYSCGVLCGCGTLRISVSRPTPDYPHDLVYVAVPCMDSLPPELEARLHWKLSRIALNDQRCFWNGAHSNKFDSRGLPFYEIAER